VLGRGIGGTGRDRDDGDDERQRGKAATRGDDAERGGHAPVIGRCVRVRTSRQPENISDEHEIGGVMGQYMLLVYQQEVGEAEQAERDRSLPMLRELYDSLREAGMLVDVNVLRRTERARSVRVRAGETEVTDGPFAVTKEVLAGYYILECADIDEAIREAERLPMAGWGTIEVRPVAPIDEFLNPAS
jgi:hypothetical protein